eukprot:TRINITY_DN35114_c0_g1_i3.p1 TRINITY_DN35114_c0_g1~~TRINITY_DN35114_c0_g1_i3.p1  ORF type:complete len:416 (-),score=89.14 TRINITY_DN35114_c0_g1_i3:252-1499(-)
MGASASPEAKCICFDDQNGCATPFEDSVTFVGGDAVEEQGKAAVEAIANEKCERAEQPEILLPGGIRYTGQWRGTWREGQGKLERPDGGCYIGEFIANKAHGQGKLMHVNGDCYEGEWKNDRAHGFGKFCHQDGSTYEGQWLEDMQEGYGVENWLDSSRFEGNYVQGQKHGQGKFYWAGGSEYSGEFLANEIHGHGQYKWLDGRSYVGQWKRSRINGQGRMIWSDGMSYEGDYCQDKKHGQGCFQWPDGRTYEGQWAFGKQHGQGRYTNVAGKVRHGEWRAGKRVRWIDEADTGEQPDVDRPSCYSSDLFAEGEVQVAISKSRPLDLSVAQSQSPARYMPSSVEADTIPQIIKAAIQESSSESRGAREMKAVANEQERAACSLLKREGSTAMDTSDDSPKPFETEAHWELVGRLI